MMKRLALLLALLLAVAGCDKKEKVLGEDDEGDGGQEVVVTPPVGGDGGEGGEAGAIGPADPPYGPEVVFPSGLRLDDLVQNAALTATYPDPASGLFNLGSERRRHYAPVGYFIEIASLSGPLRQERVSPNFKLEEYVRLPERNGGTHTYVDAQIALHAQELRDAWGGPLIVTSAFRSPEHNDAIGGSIFSRHLYGDAVDIGTDGQSMAYDLYNLAKYLDISYLEPADLTIVGKNSPWIHMDDRGWPLNTPGTR